MNIAMASFYLPPIDRIGAGYMQHYLANAYVRAGHAVTMFSPTVKKADDALYELAPVAVSPGNRFLQFAWNLRKQNLSRFDVLHTGSESFLLLGKKRPYHICTYHGSCLIEALHARKMKDRLRMLALAIAESSQCLVSNRNVCVSRDTSRFLPFAREVIWNGVDRTRFCPGPEKSPVPAIFFIGTMESRKRGAALLEAFQKHIRPALPDAELWIAREENPVVGDGVRWFGSVSPEKLVELYQRAWVFCLPSSYEGFGVPYIEAMACGTAVVATPNAGAVEVLDNGRCGRIVDLPALGRTLLDLLCDRQQRICLEQVGLERAKLFDWQVIVNSYLSTITDRK